MYKVVRRFNYAEPFLVSAITCRHHRAEYGVGKVTRPPQVEPGYREFGDTKSNGLFVFDTLENADEFARDWCYRKVLKVYKCEVGPLVDRRDFKGIYPRGTHIVEWVILLGEPLSVHDGTMME